jgi:hypothetical protein
MMLNNTRQATREEMNNNSCGAMYRNEILNADPMVDQAAIAANANKYAFFCGLILLRRYLKIGKIF